MKSAYDTREWQCAADERETPKLHIQSICMVCAPRAHHHRHWRQAGSSSNTQDTQMWAWGKCGNEKKTWENTFSVSMCNSIECMYVQLLNWHPKSVNNHRRKPSVVCTPGSGRYAIPCMWMCGREKRDRSDSKEQQPQQNKKDKTHQWFDTSFFSSFLYRRVSSCIFPVSIKIKTTQCSASAFSYQQILTHSIFFYFGEMHFRPHNTLFLV